MTQKKIRLHAVEAAFLKAFADRVANTASRKAKSGCLIRFNTQQLTLKLSGS